MDQPVGRLAQEVELLEGGGDVGLVGVFTLVGECGRSLDARRREWP